MSRMALATRRNNSTPSVRTYDNFEAALLARKKELTARIGGLLADVVAEGEPEDEGGVAIQNYSKDWAAGSLERARRTLAEVDAALARIKAGSYGVCALCHIAIPKARLEALLWARLCVSCAERNAQQPT
jgi:DnaK suppressor protein